MQIDTERTGSRKEIVRWINSILDLKVSNIEQLGTGAVYCQLLDVIKPGAVPMSKVNWKAKLEYEYISNYKILQAAILHLGIDLKLDVEKLIKCKYQDNFQMIQVFKKLVQKHGIPSNYTPSSRRNSNPDLPERKLSTINKQNNMQKSCTFFNFPLTSKSSQSKTINFFSNTSNMKSSQCLTNRKDIKISSFIPNKQKTDEEKIRLIRQIILGGDSSKLQKIKSVVFEGEENVIDSEEEVDVL